MRPPQDDFKFVIYTQKYNNLKNMSLSSTNTSFIFLKNIIPNIHLGFNPLLYLFVTRNPWITLTPPLQPKHLNPLTLSHDSCSSFYCLRILSDPTKMISFPYLRLPTRTILIYHSPHLTPLLQFNPQYP